MSIDQKVHFHSVIEAPLEPISSGLLQSSTQIPLIQNMTTSQLQRETKHRLLTLGHLGEGYLDAHYSFNFSMGLKFFETKNKNFKSIIKFKNNNKLESISNTRDTKIANILKYKALLLIIIIIKTLDIDKRTSIEYSQSQKCK